MPLHRIARPSLLSCVVTTSLFGAQVAAQSGSDWLTHDGRPALTRVREGGTPFDPNQRLTPFAVSLGTSNAPANGLVESPPEYSPARGVLFEYGGGWESVVTSCVAKLTATAAHDEIAYVVVANGSVQASATAAFIAAGATMSKVVFLVHPNDSIWLRDYGPHFIWQGGTLAIVDSHYYPNRTLDNFIPTLIGDDDFGLPTYDIGLYYSGGNFQPGPNRTGFVTALVQNDNPSSGGFTTALIEELYRDYQGIDTLHIMPQLPGTVDGTGHVDMWMYLVDENTVIISEFIAGSNATAISITNNAVPYMQALGFEVFRPKAWVTGGTHYTYANAFRVNNRIFVPVYGTTLVPGGVASYNDEDADAMAKWSAAAGPGVEIVPIQCNSIIPAAGAIHCIVMQVPRYGNAVPAAHVLAPAEGDVWVSGTTETIRWSASDTNNVALATVDLDYSLNDGANWTALAGGMPDSGSYAWLVPSGASSQARIRVTVHASDGDVIAAVSDRYRQGPGTAHVYTYASGAGSDKFAHGHQTASWSASVSGKVSPVTTALSAANYTAMSTSNATGGDGDTNRFIAPSVTSGNEDTHLFRIRLTESPADIDEIRVRWEGYADNCTQAELYVWDRVASQWGNGRGLAGQNRYLDNFAGNRDELLDGALRLNISNYVDTDGSLRLLAYGQRSGDETFVDFVSVTVKSLDDCTGDFDGNGAVDGADLATLLGAWGPCGGCAADFDDNGSVDGADLAVLLGAWGGC
jgi:agmatine deiminase